MHMGLLDFYALQDSYQLQRYRY